MRAAQNRLFEYLFNRNMSYYYDPNNGYRPVNVTITPQHTVAFAHVPTPVATSVRTMPVMQPALQPVMQPVMQQQMQVRDPNDPDLIHVGVPFNLTGRIPPKLKEHNFRTRLTKELTEPAVTNPGDLRAYLTSLPCHQVNSDDWWFW